MNVKFTWSKLKSAALITGVLALTAGLAHASAGAEGAHGGVSSEKLWDLLWRTLNFAVLVFILVKFGAKPIASALRNRRASITDQFADLEAKRTEADRAYREFEEKLATIDQDINEIIENAKARGEAEKERILEDAKRTAADIKRQAEMAVQHELALAKLNLREEVANQAVLMAEELLKQNLRQDDQVKLIENYLEKVGTVQ
ncbi:MAG: F0F1 ATP synthase subunit B [Desulfobacterales bacterium]|nr:F0F1 ATP synthase subunit B [Desulfobacterales bacterium]